MKDYKLLTPGPLTTTATVKQEMLFDLLDRAQDDIFRVNYEVFQNNDQFRDEINLLLTKPEGYTILDKILKKMREC